MGPRRVPGGAERIGVCVYGDHGAMVPVVEGLRQAGVVTVTCVASQRAPGNELGPVEAALAGEGLFEDPHRLGERLGVPVLHLPRPDDRAARRLRELGAEAVFSLSAPILPPDFLDAFHGRVFNFHGSRVYRGRAGLSWNILNGIESDAVVSHWIDAGIDTGDWIDEEAYGWADDALPVDLIRAQRPCFARLAKRLAERLRDGEVPRRPPPERPYLPGLRTDEDGWVDWRWTAGEIVRAARAFGFPYAGASATLESAGRTRARRVRLGRCEAVPRTGAGLHPLCAGAVLRSVPGGGAVVGCGDGAVRLRTVGVDGEDRPAGDVVRVGMRLSGRPGSST